MLRRDRLHRSGLLMRSQSWFCLRFLEKCEELSWERGQGSVERDHSGNRWDNGLQGLQAEQGTRPSPASAQQVGDPRDSKWGSLHPGLISVPEAGRAHPRQELAAPPSLNSTSNLTWLHPVEPSSPRTGCGPSIRTRFLTPAPQITHLSCGFVSGSGSSGVRLAATRSPASPRPILAPGGSSPAATANCACASGSAGGCCGCLGARASSSTAAKNPAAARRPWGAVLPAPVALWSSSCLLCRPVLRVALQLAPRWMGWMDRRI